MCADLGMPAEAVNFNRAIGAVMCTLSFLGWQSSGSAKPDLSALIAAPGDAAADALRYSIVLCALFGCMMLYDLDELFDQYGFSSDGDLKKCARCEPALDPKSCAVAHLRRPPHNSLPI